MSKLRERVAIVTGAASGIGAATALVMAREGARVVLADIDSDGGRKVVADIERAGGSALFVKTDVSLSSDVQQLVEETIRIYGRVDIIDNNAIWFKNGTVSELDEQDWDKTQAVCLRGAYLMGKYGVPAMQSSGGGGHN